MALLNAISLNFNECRLTIYISCCYKWLSGIKLQRPLSCFVRLDIVHFIKMICRLKVFSGKSSKVKDFYVRCVGVTTTCETKEDFKTLLSAILVVALSECDGQDEFGLDIISQQRQTFLLTA